MMKIVIGVDWSDEAFAAVQQVSRLYRATEVTLVHGIEMGVFEYPALAQLGNLQGYEELRRALLDAGRQVLDRTKQMLPAGTPTVKTVNEVGNPADMILAAAQSAGADLIVMGARGRGRLAETVLGSVSHRVLMHARSPTLIVRGGARAVQRILIAVEGKEDADRIVQWLQRHPFPNGVEFQVLSVVVPLRIAEPYMVPGLESWAAVASSYAEDLVKNTAASLPAAQHRVTTRVATGEAAAMVAEQAKDMDLVVVASHGRQGVDRFLFGSVSHAIVHRVAGPVLVVH
ncbi:MAG TPA: universal stress protein [Nitrospira sp.]|nr:universal stress protein [Nitrospira sp.]